MGQPLGYRANRCQSCGAVAPTRYVDFKQNIGMLVMRRHRTVAGNLCKPCVHKHFWTMTGTTLAVGWLGQISIVIAPIFIVNNVIRYVSVLGMPGPDGGKKSKAAIEDALPVMTYTPPPRPASDAPLAFDDGTEATPFQLLPDLNPAEVLQPHWPAMVARIKAKQTLDAVAADVAGQTGLTPQQVSDYVKDRVRRAKAAKAAAAAAVPV